MKTNAVPARIAWGLGLILLLLLLTISCGGKPDTSAPNVSDEEISEFGIKGAVNQACIERQKAIDDWEFREINEMVKNKHPNEHSAEFDRIEDESEALTEELWENCDAKWRELLFGG